MDRKEWTVFSFPSIMMFKSHLTSLLGKIMQTIHATKIIGMSELREPAKVLKADGDTLAITSRGKLVGYFVPKTQVSNMGVLTKRSKEEFSKIINEVQPEIQPVLDYLKDK